MEKKMAQQVQDLINKIKTEGIQAAEQKAAEIEAAARHKSDAIINDAKKRAEEMISEAKADIKKSQHSSEIALQQSSRNMLLSLRKEIQSLLKNNILNSTSEALNTEQLAKIIQTTVNNYTNKATAVENVKLLLNADDLKKLKDGFLSDLQKRLKGSVEFKSSQDIGKGFVVSFDNGKSSFDFTDRSLAEYLSTFLNEELAKIVKNSTSS